MKRLLLFAMVVLLSVPTVEAGRKQTRAGKIKNDSIYVDSRYDFQLILHENWKPRVKNDDEKCRLTLMQKNYAIPADYVSAPDYTQVPRVDVYVDTTTMNVHSFLDSLLADDYKSDQKSEIVKAFEFLQQPDIIPKGRSRLELNGASGVFWQGQSKYMKEIQLSASSVGGKRVYGSYGGAIAAVKMGGNKILMFHVMCEWPYYNQVLSEVQIMIRSVTWEQPEEE